MPPLRDIPQDSLDDFAESFRPSGLSHFETPSIVRAQRYEGAMSKNTAKDARDLPEAVAGRIWQYAKQRHPRHTEKNVARELGEGLSPRTVQGWRYRLPNSARFLKMMLAWGPEFIAFVLEPVDETFARKRRLDVKTQEILRSIQELAELSEPEE